MSDRDAMAAYRLKQVKTLADESCPMIRFLVGRPAKEHRIPSKLLADGFAGLKPIFEAPADAWHNREVVLADCSEDTFRRFFLALVTADYDEAGPKEILPTETKGHGLPPNYILPSSPIAATCPVAHISPPPVVKEEDNCRDSWVVYEADDKVHIPHTLPYSIRSYNAAWGTLNTREYSPWSLTECQHGLRLDAINVFLSRHLTSSKCPSRTNWKPKRYDDLEKSYLPVFMSHFEVFKVANELGFEMICEISLHRLTIALASYTVHDDGIPDLVHLVREVYDSTAPENPVRTLILNFTACFYEHICNNDSFVLALREVDGLLQDLSNIMKERYLPLTDLVGKKRRMSEKASGSSTQQSASAVHHKRASR